MSAFGEVVVRVAGDDGCLDGAFVGALVEAEHDPVGGSFDRPERETIGSWEALLASSDKGEIGERIAGINADVGQISVADGRNENEGVGGGSGPDVPNGFGRGIGFGGFFGRDGK